METLQVETQGSTVRVTLNRPDVRNAFNEVLIAELTQAFTSISADARAVVLTGAGKVFCAGGDIGWMKRSKEFTEEENARDAGTMAGMLRAIDECPVPVLARVNGHALGGGSGLIAACDIVLAAEGSMFGFTEVRLGLIPSVISNFVLPRIGFHAARRYFLTGERFGGPEAREMGLVHEVVPLDLLDARVSAVVGELGRCGPQAVREAKKLIRDIARMNREEGIEHTIRTVARVRVGPEAQEGLGAFLEKRKPNWSS